MTEGDETAPQRCAVAEAIAIVREFNDAIEHIWKQFSGKEIDQAIYVCQRDYQEDDDSSLEVLFLLSALQAKLRHLTNGVDGAISAKKSSEPFMSIKEQGRLLAEYEAEVRERRNARRRQRRKDARERAASRQLKGALKAAQGPSEETSPPNDKRRSNPRASKRRTP
ncbi:hypothetical protein [Microvirga arabica]|uniref:hypothetical protein n=1 Tax=Microvirga arabica TaxID=1128671 RepID=UPI00193A9DE1|nr:hypothetical protein [Microvirga arabica]MBM1170353.1 hypothetical protein [Microvirga arabica]